MSSPDLAILLAVIACCIGGALGGYALARPEDVVGMVGLRLDPEKRHSVSEVRATYGGLFLLSHGGVAAALGYAPGVGATMALTLALAWAGAGIGRGYTMVKDDAGTAFNVRATIFEFLMAATLTLPFWALIAAARASGVLV